MAKKKTKKKSTFLSKVPKEGKISRGLVKQRKADIVINLGPRKPTTKKKIVKKNVLKKNNLKKPVSAKKKVIRKTPTKPIIRQKVVKKPTVKKKTNKTSTHINKTSKNKKATKNVTQPIKKTISKTQTKIKKTKKLPNKPSKNTVKNLTRPVKKTISKKVSKARTKTTRVKSTPIKKTIRRSTPTVIIRKPTSPAFYKQFYEEYDKIFHKIDYKGQIEQFKKLYHNLGIKNKNVLKIGCKTGMITNLMQKEGYSVTGLDNTDYYLAEAKKNNNSVDYVKGEMKNFHLNKKFGMIICFSSQILKYTKMEDLVASLKNMHEHLDHGGVLVLDMADCSIKGKKGVINDKDTVFTWTFLGDTKKLDLKVNVIQNGIRYENHQTLGLFSLDNVKKIMQDLDYEIRILDSEFQESLDPEETVAIILGWKL